jgi:hypothetical protein
MTRRTKRHKVSFGVCPTVSQRLDVVNFLCRGKPSFTLALLAQRVRGNVAVADTFPRSAVAAACVGVAAVAFVLARVFFGMVFTKKTVR